MSPFAAPGSELDRVSVAAVLTSSSFFLFSLSSRSWMVYSSERRILSHFWYSFSSSFSSSSADSRSSIVRRNSSIFSRLLSHSAGTDGRDATLSCTAFASYADSCHEIVTIQANVLGKKNTVPQFINGNSPRHNTLLMTITFVNYTTNSFRGMKHQVEPVELSPLSKLSHSTREHLSRVRATAYLSAAPWTPPCVRRTRAFQPPRAAVSDAGSREPWPSG